MRWRSKEDGRQLEVISMMGIHVRATQVRSEDLRFCPLCLADADGPERRLHLQVWQLHLVTACPVHGNQLVDVCDRCGETFWHHRKTKPWACACGREMTEIRTIRASAGAIAIASAIMSHPALCGTACHVGADRSTLLPTGFRDLSLDDLLSAVAKIGLLATTPETADPPVGPRAKVYRGVLLDAGLDIDEAARIAEAAHAVLSDWPRSADALFSAIADRNVDADFDHPVRRMFATKMGYRLLGRLKSLDGRVVGVIDDALEPWLLRERGIYLDGRRRPKSERSGDLAIDVADAMRRLEGRVKNYTGIHSWVDAGAAAMVGKKVSLASVKTTLASLAALPQHDLEDGIEVEVWSSVKPFNSFYRRSDAIRDILSGAIRTSPVPASKRSGLAALLISASDLRRNAESRLPRTISALEKGLPASPIRRPGVRLSARDRLLQRVDALARRDAFFQPSRVSELCSDLWPGAKLVDFVSMPAVRCNYVVRMYGGRQCPRRLYSVVDVIAAMTEVHGAPC